MQLEQTLEMYRPMQMQKTRERQRVYTIVDLEYLSSSALYGSGPLGPISSGGSGPLNLGGSGFQEFKPMELSPLKLEITRKGFKIFGEEHSPPVVRLDFEAHRGLPDMHLQYGKKDYFDRFGNEAADILAELLRLNTKIKFPGVD